MVPPPYTPEIIVGGSSYFPAPYSLDPLPSELRYGLIPVGVLALCSLTATFVLICFICYRLVTWKMHYRTFLGYNQYVVLVLNLLIADMQQAASLTISFHWIRTNSILAPSAPCFGQAWLLHSGDLSSGFFVLAIAVHTFYTAVHGKRLGGKMFIVLVICIWLFAYFLTAIGIGLHGDKYFVRAGAWCWVSEAYEDDRLALHYVWVFLVQGSTVAIYIITFFLLRRKTRNVFGRDHSGPNVPNIATVQAVNRVTKLMTLYPCVYVLLTLPLSAGRMWSMAHGGAAYSNAYACFAGSLIISCGWVDSLLYTLTRRRLLKDTMPHTSSRAANSGFDDGEDTLRSKGITHTRTVTVETEEPMEVLTSRGRSVHGPVTAHGSASYEPRSPSPTESMHPILAQNKWDRRHIAQVSAELQEILDEDRMRGNEIVTMPSGWQRRETDAREDF